MYKTGFDWGMAPWGSLGAPPVADYASLMAAVAEVRGRLQTTARSQDLAGLLFGADVARNLETPRAVAEAIDALSRASDQDLSTDPKLKAQADAIRQQFHQGGRLAALAPRVDADGDGQTSWAEVQKLLQALVAVSDSDWDGALEGHELGRLLAVLDGASGGRDPARSGIDREALALLIMLLTQGRGNDAYFNGAAGVPNAPGRNLGQMPMTSGARALVGGYAPPPGSHGVDMASAPSWNPATASPGDVSPQQLRSIMPGVKDPEKMAPALNKTMQRLGMTSKQEKAAFIAQLAVESGQFKWFEELASGQAYNGRSDLGNTQPGDGPRFKGRGPIQLTGRANYTRFQAWLQSKFPGLFPNVVQNPQAVSQNPELGFLAAAFYWETRGGLRQAAQAGQIDRVSRLVNGGTNGINERRNYYQRAMQVLA